MTEKVSFDTLLTFALLENGERELAAMPTAATLKIQYVDTSAWNARLWAALPCERQTKVSLWLFRKAVVIVAVIIAMMACALMASAEVRYAVRQAILEWTSVDLTLTYETEGVPDTGTLPAEFSDHYIPSGFVQDQSNSLDFADAFLHSYSAVTASDETQCYSVDCYVIQSEGQVERFDNEHTTYSTVLVNNINATLGTSNNENDSTSYYLFWDKDGIHYTVHGNLSLDEILVIASGIY